MGVFRYFKRNLRKVENKVIRYKFNKKRKLTVSKICKVIGVDLPEELKGIADQPVSTVTRSRYDIKPNFVLFCKDINLFDDSLKKKILDNALCIFSEVPIKDFNNVVIKNNLRMYTNLIKYIREISNPFIISVTGSIGKTSTKDIMASVLREKYDKRKMFVSYGNSNSYYKVALNIKSLMPYTKVLLQEVGIGPTKKLVEECAIMLESDVVVYTNILDSHIEHYKSRENIAKYKMLLSKYGKEDGLAIVNYDDVILRNLEFKQRVISYSISDENATYYARDITLTENGTSFIIVSNIDNSRVKVKLQVIGEHYVYNALVAFAIGRYMGLGISDIKNGLFKYRTTGMRGNLFTIGGYRIFADCYNASFDSIENAAKTMDVVKLNKKNKKIAVIADVKELGDISLEVHRKIGKSLASHDIDILLFYGNEMKYAYEEYSKLKKGGYYFDNRFEMHKMLESVSKVGDLILFKGSHGMHLTDSIDIVFGTDMADLCNIGESDYEIVKEGDYEIYKFPCYNTIVKYSGDLNNVLVPEKIEDLRVTKFAADLFKDSSLKKIVLPKYLSLLTENLFMNSQLEEIVFNKKLKGISKKAFFGCEKLIQVKLPNSLIYIGRSAFENCTNLKKVFIPNSVSMIEDDAFLDVSDLVIYCNKDSYAYDFAKRMSIKVKTVKKNSKN